MYRLRAAICRRMIPELLRALVTQAESRRSRFAGLAVLSKRFRTPPWIIIRLSMKRMFDKKLICALMAFGGLVLSTLGQTKPQEPMGGVSTGAAVNYKTKRTINIIDPNAPVVFADITDKTTLRDFL